MSPHAFLVGVVGFDDMRRLIASLRGEEFEMVPLVSAASDIDKLIAAEDDALAGMPAAPKYRDVGDEVRVEVRDIFLGACFVAGQVMITRTAALLERLRDGGARLPVHKHELLEVESTLVAGVPDIAAINAIANYFKHNDEWPSPWSTPGRHASTVVLVTALGLTERNPDNMSRAVDALGLRGPGGGRRLAERIEAWRASLADRLEPELRAGGLL